MTPAEFVADPSWADCIAPLPAPGKTRHLPAHEDCSLLDVEAVQAHLRKGGTLGAMKGYEERPGQIDMTGAIAAAYNARSHLMVEAGTGVGKSLAYLVPSVLWAWTNDTPVIVSTATRNLQSQLLGADLPRALAILGDSARDFKIALLKGRTNYLCLKAVEDFFAAGYWTMSDDEQAALPGFIEWLKTTGDGDLDTYDGLPRNQLSRPGDECTGKKCPYCRRCFVYKARQRAGEAHLVVVNHALVLAEAMSPGAGILPGYGRIVMDEAHNLESIATDAFSAEFSQPELSRIIKRLLRHHKEAQYRAGEVLAAADDYLSFLARLLPPKTDVRRYRADGYYWEDRVRLTELKAAFERPLIELVHYLHDYAEKLEDVDLATRLDSDANQLLELVNEAAFVVAGEHDTHAYWIERVRRENRRSYVRLVAAPLAVGDDLRKLFYDLKDSVVLCSATLRVGNDFKYMARRLGFHALAEKPEDQPRYATATAVSPFDYFRQSLVLGLDYLPDPAANAAEYAVALAGMMKDVFTVTRGRALVLFTAYDMMNAVAAAAREPLAEAGITLLVQGAGTSREKMTETLKNIASTVLFGAQSFWEGVDVAGEALSCVVIARLPFPQLGEPIVEARGERIQRSGGSSFRDYLLPEAVIKFRQGFGRLIRTKTDRGVVIVADPRIIAKSYGGVFRKSIPATVHTVTGPDELASRTEAFLPLV